MDGAYYKAFQKCLSRPRPFIFNKIFSQSEKQSQPELLRKRTIHLHCAGDFRPFKPSLAPPMKMCQIHEACDFQRLDEVLEKTVEASGKTLAMMPIKSLFETREPTLRTLRHIDA